MDLTSQKQQTRRAMKERMEKMKESERQAESRSVVRRVLENFPEGAHTVCAYYPMRTEVDIVPLLEELLNRGCELYLPRGARKGFEFWQVLSLDELVPGPFGVLEPTDDTVLLDKEDIEYVLVPGIAFDQNGNRMGRGNGGYDTWLNHVRAQNNTAEIWGLCLDSQVLREIPIEAHDEKMDVLVTPREAKRFI